MGQCKISTNATDFTGHAVHYWDLAMAMWIGEQVTDVSDRYLMFSLLEGVKNYFEWSLGRLSKTNKRILDEMAYAKQTYWSRECATTRPSSETARTRTCWGGYSFGSARNLLLL